MQRPPTSRGGAVGIHRDGVFANDSFGSDRFEWRVAYLVLVLVDLRVRRGAVLAHLELAAEAHARVVALLEALQAHPAAARTAGRLFGRRFRFAPVNHTRANRQ